MKGGRDGKAISAHTISLREVGLLSGGGQILSVSTSLEGEIKSCLEPTDGTSIDLRVMMFK